MLETCYINIIKLKQWNEIEFFLYDMPIFALKVLLELNFGLR